MELTEKDALTLSKLISKREVSSKEVVDAYLNRIEKVEPVIHAFINLSAELARKQALEIDEKLSRGEEAGRYAGVPIAIKDVLSTKSFHTTCASRMLENFIPIYDATAVRKVFNAGCVMIGKANMDEFAMGSSTENSYFGVTRNPWDTNRVPGGSSGGSAAAVAAREAPWALGSDTGGSIRQPAALCGIVGLKPTYGLVSRYGLVAFASSLDQVGPMTLNVKDCAALLGLIAGHDPLDSTSIPRTPDEYLSGLTGDVRGLKAGVVKEISGEGIDPDVLSCFYKGIGALEECGVHVEEVTLPSFEYALSAYYIIAPAEASSNLARFDGIRYGFRTECDCADIWEMYDRTRSEGFGGEVKRRIMLGTYALSAGYYEAYYAQAQKIRTLIIRDYNRAWDKFDVLLSPTSPTTAFKIGEKIDDPLTMYLSDICTIPVNLAGIPAISVPCGFSKGLPVGFQIMGPPLEEARILNVAYALEQSLNLDMRPPV